MSDYLRTPAPYRLAMWKAQDGRKNLVADWRRPARSMLGFRIKPEGFSPGFNGEGRYRKPVYVAFDAQLPETEAHIVLSLNHTGWYTDTDYDGLAIGIIAKLPHNRWLAGYRLTMNDERVFFTKIHNSAEDAARMADEHARIIAESEMEYSEKGEAARELQSEIAGYEEELGKAFALRNHKRYSDREGILELIRTIREKREELKRDYSDYI